MVQSWYVHLIPRIWYLDSFAESCVGIHIPTYLDLKTPVTL
jgi:hypothetical protein